MPPRQASCSATAVPTRVPGLLLAGVALAAWTRAAGAELPAVPGIEPPPPPAEPRIAAASDEPRTAAAAIGLPAGFTARLFAAEPLVANPVAFSIDERGRVFVCEAFRAGGRGVFDNNGRDAAWIDADLATQSVAERFTMLRDALGDKARDAVVESDRLRRLIDDDGDGVADRTTVFATGFNRLVEGHGAGVLARRGAVLYACIPSLWRLRDADDDGVADDRTALHTGYGVRVAFHGHDLHGLTPGPDGRIYFTIGDRGYRVAHEGRLLADTESGAVLRCEPDGSRLEVVHTGLRNPQELAFDDLGSLFTVDNNSDSGDRARLVQIVPGGDSGWRMSFQYLLDRGPFSRERIWHLPNTEQPADIVPPLAHLSSGPAGLAAYPGTGLTPHFAGRFFLADFRGAAAGSGVWTFRVRPQGASFAACDEELTFRNLLATDVEVGPDGAVWVSDWVHGWDGEGRGRIWRFVPQPEDPAAAANRDRVVTEVRDLLAGDWSAIAAARLTGLLAHADRRVRLDAQFELARRADAAGLVAVAADSAQPLLARVHAIQGLGQIGRRTAGGPVPSAIVTALGDPAWELRLVAARTAGDLVADAADVAALVPLLADDHPHVRAAAALALAAATSRGAPTPTRAATLAAALVEAIGREAGRDGGCDPHARHAIAMAVTATADAAARARLARHDDAAVRLVACVAMRRRGDPAIAALLADTDAKVAVEAARGIHDAPIETARPALAARLLAPPTGSTASAGERDAFLRRAIAAAEREATAAAAARLATFIGRADMPTERRIEAADVLRCWAAPPSRDRVLGMWRPCPLPRDPAVAAVALSAALPQLLGTLAAEGDAALSLRQAVLEAAAALGVESAGDLLAASCRDTTRGAEPRAAALVALAALGDPRAAELAASLSRDAAPLVRLEARRVRARAADAAARTALARELGAVVTTPAAGPATLRERQDAVDLLAALDDDEARRSLADLRDRLDAGTLDPRLALEVREAAEAARPPAADAAELLAGGDAVRGHAVFLKTAGGECIRCHRVGGTGGDVGPALDGIGSRRDRRHLLESIVAPSASIADGYRTAVIVTTDGRTLAGVVREEDTDGLVVTAADGTRHRIAQATIEERSEGGSAMPADLATKLTRREIRDLVAWLASLTTSPSP